MDNAIKNLDINVVEEKEILGKLKVG